MSGRPRFLLVRLSSLGDVALATSVVGSLRESLPGCHLTFLTQPRYAALLEHHPGLDDLVLAPAAPRSAWGWARFGATLRARRFDVLLDLQYNWRTLGLALGLAPLRVRRWDRAHFARRALLRDRSRPPLPHMVERLHRAAHPWLAGPPHGPHVAGGAEAWRAALALLAGWAPPEARWLGVVPVARWDTKRWPPERWAELCRRWTAGAERHALAFFGPDDAAVRDAFRAALGPAPRVHLAAEGLGVAAELLRRMEVVVAGDTGLMQLAVAVGTPTVALFGATSPAFGFAPYGPNHRAVTLGLACQPCALHGALRCPLGHFRCLQDLGVERVEREMAAVAARRPADSAPAAGAAAGSGGNP
ncbi:MAG TPA: glycosyltransferase family 9 protein [Candidatus Saccharimonadales bacterium]|nr:glycosyltransferase family 9 protein [Candidatus Saccharimonadales bacterium]